MLAAVLRSHHPQRAGRKVNGTKGEDMYNLSLVMRRVDAGDKVRVCQDFYGKQWVQLTTGRLFKRRTRVELPPNDLMQVKAAVKSRRKGSTVDLPSPEL